MTTWLVRAIGCAQFALPRGDLDDFSFLAKVGVSVQLIEDLPRRPAYGLTSSNVSTRLARKLRAGGLMAW